MSSAINPQEIRVALLAGGRSGEREISLASGKGVHEALLEAGFSVTMLDPINPQDMVELIEGGYDVAFLALHGKYGEDGTIQGMLELFSIPYTGPGVWSSATAIDKPKAKIFYERNGIATPHSLDIYAPDQFTPEQIAEHIGVDCVIKAATEGSALGVYICHSLEDIAKAVQDVFEVDTVAFGETFVAGDEYTVAVLGNDKPEPLPVIQIVPKNEFYDFESKYAAGGSEHICPAPLSEADTRKAQELALAAHRALDCTGVSRTDLIKDANGKFWVLETNTIPGMTATSLLPDAARVAGMTFPELCTRMVADALDK
jgi:D-alanine-D-alanine ligase